MSVAKRYAKALYLYATENGAEDAVYEEALRLDHTFANVHDVLKVITNPQVKTDRKKQLIASILDNHPTSTLQRFVGLVFLHRREAHMRLIMLMYIDLYREKKNIHVGRITTAVPMSDKIVQRIRHEFEKQQGGIVDFSNRVNPDIEGGFIFEINSLRLDASVRNQMQRIKKQFIEKNKRIV